MLCDLTLLLIQTENIHAAVINIRFLVITQGFHNSESGSNNKTK